MQAHGHETHGAAGGAPVVSDWVDGEVHRIDLAARKITLRHGEIAALAMPPMTMVFQVRDAALLQGLQPGQRVRFRATQVHGAYLVTEIKPGS
nr:copper-binding protein [Tepidimonas alkaliphilus]